MGKEILNRRQNIIAGSIPPEIPSEAVSATDYATSTKGGTVKVDGDYGVELTAAGKLRGTVETAEAYAEAGNNLLVSKGTLDNVLAAQPGGGGFTADVLYDAPATPEAMSQLTVTLAHDIADYKLVCVIGNRSTTKSAMTLPVILGFETWMPIINYSGNLVPALINIPAGGGTSVTVHCDTPAGMTLHQIIGYK